MSRNQPRLDFDGTRGDRRRVRNVAALEATTVTVTADLTVLAQTTNQCTAQLAARNDVNRRIDGLVGDSLCHVLRVIAPQSRRNLLWGDQPCWSRRLTS